MKKLAVFLCSLFVFGISAQEAKKDAALSNEHASYYNRVGSLKLAGCALQACALARISHLFYRNGNTPIKKAVGLTVVASIGHGTYETYRSAQDSFNKAKKDVEKKDDKCVLEAKSLAHRLQHGTIGLCKSISMVVELGACIALAVYSYKKAEKRYNKKNDINKLVRLGAAITSVPTTAYGAYKTGISSWHSFKKAFAQSTNN